MNLVKNRVFFSPPPVTDELAYQGRIYDLAAGADLIAEVRRLVRRPEKLNDLEADLAAVAYDSATRSWRLLRDFGQSPLYYAPLEDGFVWSFSYTDLLALLDRPQPDEATMFDYLATHYRYIFRDPARTFHQGVRQVPAGSFVDIRQNGEYSTGRWLDLRHDPETYKMKQPEATEKLMALLRESVRLRVAAFSRPAFTVSSGLDSGTVASLAAGELRSIDVFSVGYAGPGAGEYDETAGVAELIKGRDWRWTNLVLEHPDLLAETEKLISLTSSPVVTATWLAYYLMGRKLSGFNRVFNGLGGDESLAGEFVHFFYFFADLKKDKDEERLADEVEAWSRLHDHPVFKKNRSVMEDFWRRNIDFPSGEMRVDQKVYQANWRFFNPEWLDVYGPASPPMPRPYPNFLSNRLFQETTYETTPPTLWGLFMANQALGLTGVSPFMTPRLFRHCLSLPGTVKYDHGLTKALLRRGLKGVLPESLRLNTKKTGFNAPIHQWFAEAKTAVPTLELLRNGPLAARHWLKKDAAEIIFEEHMTGRANHMMLLWPLLNASLFLK